MKIEELRVEIDKVDKEIKELFQKRMNIAKKIGEIKKSQGLAVEDKAREKAIIEKNAEDLPKELKDYYKSLLEKMIDLSKEYQKK